MTLTWNYLFKILIFYSDTPVVGLHQRQVPMHVRMLINSLLLLVRPESWLLFRRSGVVYLLLLAWWQRDLTHSQVSWRSKMQTSSLQEYDSWSWELTAARGTETTTYMYPRSTTTGFTKGVFKLAWPFQHTHTLITGFTKVSTESYFFFQISLLKHPISVAQVCSTPSQK